MANPPILNLPSEILNEICEFLATNKELTNVRALCRQTKMDIDWYGYIRNITLGFHSSAMNFIALNSFNLKALRYLSLERLAAPQSWVTCVWPETTLFRQCHSDAPLSPPPGSRTTSLHLVDMSTKGNGKLIVEWDKLPDLKKIYIATDCIELEGLEKCINLEVVIIELRNHKTIPEALFKLPKLRVIVSNVGPPPDKEIYVISDAIEKCLVPKKMKFICQSKVVPKSHITENISVNVRLVAGDYMYM